MSLCTKGTYHSAGLQLAYREFGDSHNPTVIIHHGFLDCAMAWDEIAEHLCPHFHVVSVDARGHGDSEWIGLGGAYWFPDYVLDLRTLMDALAISETAPCALVGHSMGGAVCSYAAGTYPRSVRALALLEGLGPPRHPWSHAPFHMRQFIETTRARQANREPEVIPSIDAVAKRLQHYDRLLSDDSALQHAKLSTRRVKGGYVWKWDPLHRARTGTMYVEEIAIALLSEVTAPVRLIEGRESPYGQLDTSKRHAAIRTKSRTEIPHAGHNLHRHTPQALASDLLQFLLANS